MALIDMLTDIKSFNYKKVGKKHDEYFGEDAATGFTPNREPGDKTEFRNKDSIFGPGGNVDFFKDKNATGFTDNRNTKDPSEYIPGSGNDFNFKNKTNTVDYFSNINATGFTHGRFNVGGDDIGNTEFIIGSGNNFNFTEPIGFSTFNTTRAYTIDRETGDETEFSDGGSSLYSVSPAQFTNPANATDFFANKMIGEGFVIGKDKQLRQSDFYGANTPGYINFNSMQLPRLWNGVDYFSNINATGFTTKRTENDLGPVGGGFVKVAPGGTAGEYIIGSGLLDLDGSPISGPTDFFPDSFGVGFVKNVLVKYNANELNTDGSAGRSMFNLGTVIETAGAADASQENFELSIGNVRTARTSVEEQTHGVRKLARSSSPNIPFSYHFSPEHPYGEVQMDSSEKGKALRDRDDIDDQYIKFGGNKIDDHAGLRATSQNEGHPSHGGYGAAIGTDQPYILKSIPRDDKRARYYTGASTLDAGIFRGGLPLNLYRVVDDALRLGSWTLTARGIIWNAKQFLLQQQNPVINTRIFNPAGIFASIVPGVHSPRHTVGTFLDLNDPPGYDQRPDGFNITTAAHGPGNAGPEKEPTNILEEAQQAGAKLKRKAAAAAALLKGELISNRLEALRDTQRIDDSGKEVDEGQAGFRESIGLGNTHFTNPNHEVKSTKAPFGGDLDNIFGNQLTAKFGNTLNTKYSTTEQYKSKLFGQSQYQLLNNDGEVSDTLQQNYPTVIESNVDKSLSDTLAKNENLGRGYIKKGSKLYEVGVSNMLQVPYHGQFNKLNSSLADLPKDFIKFRIREAVNGKWLIFPAHLGTITDTTTPEWTKERYIGRPDQTHIYTGASRNVSFDFKVAAFTKQEIPILQEKMNYLVGLAWPTYKSDETPVSPYVYLTIGDLFNNTPGYFENVTVTIEENATWEIDDGHQIPQFFNVSLTFVHVGKYLPTTTGKHYEVPWLKDHGGGASSHGTFDKDPRDGSTSRPFIKGTQGWNTQLPIKS